MRTTQETDRLSKDVEKTRKLLREAKKTHRLARAKLMGMPAIVTMFWISFIFFVTWSVGIGEALLLPPTAKNFALLLFFIPGEIAFFWAIVETTKMRKLLNDFRKEN